MSAHSVNRFRRPVRGYSLVEILAAMAIFLVGIVGILNFFPNILEGENEALLVTAATLEAQQKIMEIRRDDASSPAGVSLTDAIRARTTPTEPIIFARDPRLAYAFNGLSLLDPVDDADDPGDDAGVARVIIIKVEQARVPPASQADSWNILAEMRFDAGS